MGIVSVSSSTKSPALEKNPSRFAGLLGEYGKDTTTTTTTTGNAVPLLFENGQQQSHQQQQEANSTTAKSLEIARALYSFAATNDRYSTQQKYYCIFPLLESLLRYLSVKSPIYS